MKNWRITFWVILIIGFTSCIGDDFVDDAVDPELRITNLIDSLQVGTEYQFDSIYLNNVGLKEDASIEWLSSNPSIISISNSGLAKAIVSGQTTISATANTSDGSIDQEFVLIAGENTSSDGSKTERTGKIRTSSSYRLVEILY